MTRQGFSTYTAVLGTLILLCAATGSLAQSNLEYFFGRKVSYDDVLVEEVLSPDSFRIEGGEIIHMIGLRAEEQNRRRRERVERDQYGFRVEPEIDTETPLEERAFEFVRELLEEKRVRLEFDAQRRNDQNQTLAYVFLLDDGTLANVEIIRQGYAHLSIRPPNLQHEEKLREAYREARSEKRGLQGQ